MNFLRNTFRRLGKTGGPGEQEGGATASYQMITAARDLNWAHLTEGRTSKYSLHRGTPVPVVNELARWVTEAMKEVGEPVPFPTTLILSLIRMDLSDDDISDIPDRFYKNFAGVVMNVEDALAVIVLNTLRVPIATCAFCDHPHPDLWSELLEIPDAKFCSEPTAPWGASVFCWLQSIPPPNSLICRHPLQRYAAGANASSAPKACSRNRSFRNLRRSADR